MKRYKVVRWKFGGIYTPKHIINRSNTLLCNMIYPHNYELIVTHHRVLVDDVDCLNCVERFGELAIERYEKNKVKNPLILRLGL